MLMEEEELLGWLYDHTKEAGILSSTLVSVFHSQGKATQLLHCLTKKEILSTSTPLPACRVRVASRRVCVVCVSCRATLTACTQRARA
jgi:hypothetical protein